MLSTIHVTPGSIINKNFYQSQNGPTGVLPKVATYSDYGIVGKETQYLEFSGGAGIFDDENAAATDEEKVKGSGDSVNSSVPVHPILYTAAQRLPRRFIELFEGDGYSQNYSALTTAGDPFRAGDPASKLLQILNQPWQGTMLDNFRQYVTREAGKSLDMAAIFGVNSKTEKKSEIARQNDFLLNYATRDVKIKHITWDAPSKPTQGATPAGNVFTQAVHTISEDVGDFSVQAITTPEFEWNIAREQTTIGSPSVFAAGLPLVGDRFSIMGVPLYIAPLLKQSNLAQEAGLSSNTVVDAIFGDFTDRMRFSITPVGGIQIHDSGNPDNSPLGDLGGKNQVLLRVEYYLAWEFIGGTPTFCVVTHEKNTTPAQVANQSEDVD